MKSVLKWVGAKHNIGGKSWHVLPKGGRFIEPFGGSGAVNDEYELPRIHFGRY